RGFRTSPKPPSIPGGGIGFRSPARWRASGCWAGNGGALPVPDHEHVPVLDDVLLALQAQQTFFAHAGVAGVIDERLPVHHFSPDEFLFEIRMDGSRGSYGGASDRYSPGAHFRLAGGQKRHEAEQPVGGV